MINIERNILFIKGYFNYLETVLDYKILDPEITNRHFAVLYQKGEMLVKIFYSLSNHWIEITIYNHISKIRPGDYSWRYSVTLSYLMQYKKRDFDSKRDYESIMPKNIPDSDSIQKLALLFQEFAKPILEGKEWISWGEIAGYDQFVPEDLP